jgi:hypothetical protein
MMELNPKYAGVIIRRWQQFTGKKPSMKMTAHSMNCYNERAIRYFGGS